MHARLRTALRIFRGDESGQSLIIIALSMTVVLAACALVIDGGLWMASHHHDQVVADSAALAAANCLAHPSATPTKLNGATVPACISGTDTTAATTVADDYAAANGIPNPATNLNLSFDTTNGTVTANVSNTSKSFFAALFKIHSTTQSAGAQAAFMAAATHTITKPAYSTTTTPVVSTTTTTTPSSCTTAAQNAGECYVIYATNSACPGSTNDTTTGAVISGGSSYIGGGVHSEGQMFLNEGLYYGLTYGTGSGCGAYTYSGLNNCWNGCNAWSQTGSAFDGGLPTAQSVSPTVPVPYGASGYPFPTCTKTLTSGTLTISGANGNTNNAPTNTVFCYTNTSTSAATMTIAFGGNATGDTFICQSATGAGACNVTINGGSITFSANNYPTNKLLMYASGDAYLGGGSATFTGDVDTPNGTITVGSGSNSDIGLLEGSNVIFGAGSGRIMGDGPIVGGGVTTTNTTTTGYTTVTQTTYNTTTTSTPGIDSLSK